MEKNNTLPETNKSQLKMDGWKLSFLLGRPIFRGYVSFRGCNPLKKEMTVMPQNNSIIAICLRKTFSLLEVRNEANPIVNILQSLFGQIIIIRESEKTYKKGKFGVPISA